MSTTHTEPKRGRGRHTFPPGVKEALIAKVKEIMREGVNSNQEIADKLNALGLRRAGGGQFCEDSISHFMRAAFGNKRDGFPKWDDEEPKSLLDEMSDEASRMLPDEVVGILTSSVSDRTKVQRIKAYAGIE